mgnify:CR=1 FL=1
MTIQKLIDQTYSYFVGAQGTDLADLYKDDLTDFQTVQSMMGMKDYSGVSVKIDDMDTDPREQVVIALASEFGNAFTAKYLGYTI